MMMTTLVFVSAFCLVAVLVYMARYSGRVRISQTRLIDAPLDQVFAQVADFQYWGAWNPWLAHETEARLKVIGQPSSIGSQCAWDNTAVGAGSFELVRTVALKSITQKMRLKQPFLVRGRSEWTFIDHDGKTEVRWQINARVGFAMRAFSQTVKAALELDGRFGLDRLAAVLEPVDAPRYQLTVIGAREIEACRYVYRTYQGPIKGLPEAMRQYHTDLHTQLETLGIKPTGAPLAYYTKTNIKLRTTVCHVGLPIGNADAAHLAVRDMPAHRAFAVRLQGDCAALELAWYCAMQRLTIDKLKSDQRLPPFETYLITGATEHSKDCVTEVNIPLLRSN